MTLTCVSAVMLTGVGYVIVTLTGVANRKIVAFRGEVAFRVRQPFYQSIVIHRSVIYW